MPHNGHLSDSYLFPFNALINYCFFLVLFAPFHWQKCTSSYSVFSFQRSLSSENNAVLDRKIQIMWPCSFLLKLCFSPNFRMMSHSNESKACSFNLANLWDSILEFLYHCWHCVVLLSSKKIPHKTKGLEHGYALQDSNKKNYNPGSA